MVRRLLCLAAFLTTACSSGTGREPTGALSEIRLPPGFHIEIYADNIAGARSMTRAPSGTLFVGSRGAGRVYAVVPLENGTREVVTLASGLESPNGVAFKDGALFVAEISRVIRFDDIESHLRDSPTYEVVNDDFPGDGHHGWKFMAFGPDGKLYVPVGVPCNICDPEDERFGTILRMHADGDSLEIFASGIRNTVGFDWHPETGELWFTDNGRDLLGDDLPPDELNRAPQAGLHFGFPHCYGAGHADPVFENADCKNFVPSALDLGAHVAALGMRFYTGSMFPEKYRGGIFIAEHGSWNRSTPIGYRVVFVRLNGNDVVSSEIFAEGWLQSAGAWGRPVDVLVLPDGSLLVSDDEGGAIYRIVYSGG